MSNWSMGDDMKRLRNEREDAKEIKTLFWNQGVAIDPCNEVGLPIGKLTVMGGNLTGKSMMGAEAAKTLKLAGLISRTNMDNNKIDPGYMYELINQLKNQINREKPNKNKVKKIFNKFRAEIADNVVFFKGIAEDSDKLAKMNDQLRHTNTRHVTEKNQIGTKKTLLGKKVEKLRTENTELKRKLACFEEDGEVSKIRSRLVNVIRKQT